MPPGSRHLSYEMAVNVTHGMSVVTNRSAHDIVSARAYADRWCQIWDAWIHDNLPRKWFSIRSLLDDSYLVPLVVFAPR